MFHDKDSMHPLLDFLRLHNYNGKILMLNNKVQNVNGLQAMLRKAGEYLSTLPSDTSDSKFERKFQEIGFERGWGDNTEHVSEMFHMLLDLFEAPDACTLETFLGRISMVFNVVILSPHGYFAQENVLGFPDYGGQVVYILDQVPALEREMIKLIKEHGLDIIPRILIVTRLLLDAVGTTCNQCLKKVFGAEHSHILRVPFRTEKGILRKWISRFEVWPYMETFTEDIAKEIVVELQAKPDLIIGNYSEGNLVASLLATTVKQLHYENAQDTQDKWARGPWSARAQASLPRFQVLLLRQFGSWGPEITSKFDPQKDTRVDDTYLMFGSVNVTIGEKEERMMMTGLHTVVDILCVSCGSIVGWKYESTHEKSQKYKEGKFILERFKVFGPDGNNYSGI